MLQANKTGLGLCNGKNLMKIVSTRNENNKKVSKQKLKMLTVVYFNQWMHCMCTHLHGQKTVLAFSNFFLVPRHNTEQVEVE